MPIVWTRNEQHREALGPVRLRSASALGTSPPVRVQGVPCERSHVISVRYKGFRIHTRSYQTHLAGLWTVDLEVRRNGRKKRFSLAEHYFTQQEADDRCAAVGRRIIDQNFAGWSVESLRGGGMREWAHRGWTRVTARGNALVEKVILAIVALVGIMMLSAALLSSAMVEYARSFSSSF